MSGRSTAIHEASHGVINWTVPPAAAAASPAPVAAAPSTSVTQPNETITLLAGLAWIGAALSLGFLAFLQLEYASAGFADADEVRALALWNGVSAAITVFFGAKLIMGVDRRFLFSSFGWAALNMIWGVVQINEGFTHAAFLMATLLAGAAGVLSVVSARQR